MLETSLQNKIRETIFKMETCRTNVQTLEDQLRNAKSEKLKTDRGGVLLQKLAALAGWSFDPSAWRQSKKDDYPDDHSYEWVDTKIMTIGTHEFRITLTKRRDMKKMKYEVQVFGAELYLADTINQSSSGRDTDYIQNKYKDETLQKKFSSQDDAESFIQTWIDRIETDHKSLFDEQRQIIRAFQKEGLTLDTTIGHTRLYERSKGRTDFDLSDLGIVPNTEQKK